MEKKTILITGGASGSDLYSFRYRSNVYASGEAYQLILIHNSCS